MRKSLLCLLSAFLVLSSMTARNFNGTDLISIDFWVNGATDIEVRYSSRANITFTVLSDGCGVAEVLRSI